MKPVNPLEVLNKVDRRKLKRLPAPAPYAVNPEISISLEWWKKRVIWGTRNDVKSCRFADFEGIPNRILFWRTGPYQDDSSPYKYNGLEFELTHDIHKDRGLKQPTWPIQIMLTRKNRKGVLDKTVISFKKTSISNFVCTIDIQEDEVWHFRYAE